MARWLFVAITLSLAGCADPPAASLAGEPMTIAGPDGEPIAAASVTLAAFPGVEPFSETLWANGTLKPEMAGRAPMVPFGSPLATSIRAIEVGELIPREIPVILVGEIRSEMTHGSVFIWFTTPDAEFRNGAFGESAGGSQHVEQGLVRTSSEPIALNVFYDAAEPAAEVPYVLSASLTVDPTLVRAAFPVGLTLGEGVRSFEVQLEGARRDFAFDLDTPNLMLWGPDDAFLGHFPLAASETTIELPDDAEAGEYVVLLSQGGRAMRIQAAGAPTLRALPQEFVVSEEHAGATPQAAEWTTTYERVPVLAGVLFSPSTVTPDVSVSLASTIGPLLEGTATGPWFNAPVPEAGISANFWWDSAYGVPELAAGDYRASVTAATAAGSDPIRARDIAAFWSR